MTGSQDSTAKAIEISVIVPVYNVEPFLDECLDSLVDQSFTQPYEILLIDDCSSDGSRERCRNFAREYPQIVQLFENEENRGVSVSRNRGLEAATGTYFMFVDPDDVLPRTTLEKLHAAAIEYGCDIVKGNNTIFSQRSEKAARYNVTSDKLVRSDAVLQTLYEHRFVRGHPWGKLFLRQRLGNCRFPVGVRMAQDLGFCAEVFASADSLLMLNEDVYRYRDRSSGSTGKKYQTGSYLDWLQSVEDIGQYASSPAQKRAHKKLLLRTMTQLARECRHLPAAEAQPVFETITQNLHNWKLSLANLLLVDRLGPRSLVRFVKLQLAMRQIRLRLKHPT